MNNKQYYNINDITKIDSFLSIPKVLFSDKRFQGLTVSAKLMYSLYLNRYINTTYTDNQKRPYIIYSDEDIMKKLNVSFSSCNRNRKSLKEAGLINYEKTVSYNKIFLYNYNSEVADEFYYESDLNSYSFLRFPNELFDEKYINLPLSAKLQYAMYFDTMCLSQMNYFVDEKDRLYFQESAITQEKKLNLHFNTIRKGRDLLKATGLLFEYHPFSQDTRFYLIKLFNFHDNILEYTQLSKKEQTKFLKQKMESMKNELIVNKEKRDYYVIRQLREKCKLTGQQMTDIINENLSLHISIASFRNWDSGKRNYPQKIYDFSKQYLEDYYKNITNNKKDVDTISTNLTDAECVDSIFTNMKDEDDKVDSIFTEVIGETGKSVDSISLKEIDTFSQKRHLHKHSSDIYINNTESIKTENIETDLKNNLLINLVNDFNNLIYYSKHLEEQDKNFLQACFDKLKLLKRFYISKAGKMIEEDELIKYLTPLKQDQFVFDSKMIDILDRIYTSGYYFKTPDQQINCFLTFLLNDLKVGIRNDTPDWFTPVPTSRFANKSENKAKDDYPEEIKNFKWWE